MRGISDGEALLRLDGENAARTATGTLVADAPGSEGDASKDASNVRASSPSDGTGVASGSVMAVDLFPPGLEGQSRTQVRLGALASSAASMLSAVRRAATRSN
jgi:hypothetical protein